MQEIDESSLRSSLLVDVVATFPGQDEWAFVAERVAAEFDEAGVGEQIEVMDDLIAFVTIDDHGAFEHSATLLFDKRKELAHQDRISFHERAFSSNTFGEVRKVRQSMSGAQALVGTNLAIR